MNREEFKNRPAKEIAQALFNLDNNISTHVDGVVVEEALFELFRLRDRLADREGLAKVLYGIIRLPVPGKRPDGKPIYGWETELKHEKEFFIRRADHIVKYLNSPHTGEGENGRS